MYELSTLQQVAVWALPILFGITVHEVAHGWMAKQLGDPTAMMLGRLTLNPLKHIDPIGTVLVPAVLLVLGGIVLGWAKPVPVTVQNLHQPKRDMALVALAGPLANLAMGIGWALLARFGVALAPEAAWVGIPLVFMGIAGMVINSVLAVLNLLPLPPLDGGRVLAGLLPERYAWQLNRIEPYGLILVLLLLGTGLLGKILQPFINGTQGVLGGIAGVPL